MNRKTLRGEYGRLKLTGFTPPDNKKGGAIFGLICIRKRYLYRDHRSLKEVRLDLDSGEWTFSGESASRQIYPEQEKLDKVFEKVRSGLTIDELLVRLKENRNIKEIH